MRTIRPSSLHIYNNFMFRFERRRGFDAHSLYDESPRHDMQVRLYSSYLYNFLSLPSSGLGMRLIIPSRKTDHVHFSLMRG